LIRIKSGYFDQLEAGGISFNQVDVFAGDLKTGRQEINQSGIGFAIYRGRGKLYLQGPVLFADYLVAGRAGLHLYLQAYSHLAL